MKILHIYKDYHPIFGGIEGHLETLAERQVQLGHDVTVLVTNPGGQPAQETRNGVKIIRAHRLATIASTPLSVQMPWLVRQLQPDIAHLQFPYPVGEVSQWLCGRRHPFVISYQSDVVKQKAILKLYGPILKRVLNAADQIIPATANYMRSSPWLQPLQHKCTPVPIGIAESRFVNAQPLEKFKRDKPTILFVGRHRHYKGVDVLIKALTQVPNAHLLITGDGVERANYEAAVQQNGLANRVTFLGNVPHEELPSLYQSADIFTLPSINRAEAFGIVLLEAMAAGLPCVTTELSTGTSFVVQDQQTGYVVPPSDPQALAHALNTLLQNPQQRHQMGEAGRQRLFDLFTIERMVTQIQAVYEQVLA